MLKIAFLATLILATPAYSATIQSPGDAASLRAAVKTAQPNDVIQVTSPITGVDLSNLSFTGPVTIDLGEQTYSAISANNSKNITFRYGEGQSKDWHGCFSIGSSDSLSIYKTHCTGVGGTGAGITFRGGTNIQVNDSDFDNMGGGIAMIAVNGFKLIGNDFYRMRADGIDLGGSSNGEVANTVCIGSMHTPMHNDCIQAYKPTTTYGLVTNVRIHHNYAQGFTQGIGVYNGATSLTVENNNFLLSQYNAIALGGCTNCIVRHNHVATLAIENPPGRATINALTTNNPGLIICENVVEPFGFATKPIGADACTN